MEVQWPVLRQGPLSATAACVLLFAIYREKPQVDCQERILHEVRPRPRIVVQGWTMTSSQGKIAMAGFVGFFFLSSFFSILDLDP